MTTTDTTDTTALRRPGPIGRIRSGQAGHPSGLLGRLIGRAMVRDTAASNDRAVQLLGLDEPRTVLEIGFGQGRTAAELVAGGHRVLGVEVSKTMVNQAVARNRRAVRDRRAVLVESDGLTIPFGDDEADAAFTTHTIYFMPEPRTTFADTARVLRPGGRLVIACRVGDDEMPAWMDPTVYRIPRAAEIETMLCSVGFEMVAHEVGDESTHHTHLFVAELP